MCQAVCHIDITKPLFNLTSALQEYSNKLGLSDCAITFNLGYKDRVIFVSTKFIFQLVPQTHLIVHLTVYNLRL